MTNAEFWRAVQNIIDEEFNAEGLLKLEEYAERIISGQIVYKRFSSTEQHGCIDGGAIHVIASLLSGAEIDSNQILAPVGSFKAEQQRAAIQAQRIELWAKAVGCWVNDTDKSIPIAFGEHIAQGGEAMVYDNGTSLIKVIGLDYFVLPILALDRVTLHNAYFPQSRMTVIGFGRNSKGEFVTIVQQPFIQGVRMTNKEIAEYAEQLGFQLINPRNWTYATADVYLSDLHDENVIRSNRGNVFVIDCDIRINTPDLRAGGCRKLSTEIEFIGADH